MGKKGGLSDFEFGMVVGGVLQKLLICWDFKQASNSRVCKEFNTYRNSNNQ